MTGRARALSIVVTALVVGFVGLEINLRVFGGPIQIFNPLNGFHDGDPVLGWRGKKDIARRFHTPEFDVLVRHDADGFRAPEPPRPEGASANLLVLGDSLAWGWGVEQGEVFTDHLQRALAPDVAVYNRAVNAFSTGQEYLLLQQELDERDYAGVLLIVSRTDIGDNADDKKHRPAFDLTRGELTTRNQPPPGALKNPVEHFIDDHSYAVNFISWQLAALKRWKQTFEKPREEIPRHVPEPHEVPAPPVNDESPGARTMPGYGVSARLLTEIVRTCRERGVPLHLAYATTYLQQRHTPVDAGFRDLVAEIAERENTSFVDLNDTLEELYADGVPALIPRDGHWSAAGHQAVADVFLASGVLPPRSP